MDLREKKLFSQVVAQLLIIDGELTDTEYDFLQRVMDDLGLTELDRKDVTAGVNIDSSVQERVAQLSEADRADLIFDLKTAAGVDDRVSAVEERMIALVRGQDT